MNGAWDALPVGNGEKPKDAKGVVLGDADISAALLSADHVGEESVTSSAALEEADETGGPCGGPNVNGRADAAGSVASGFVAYETGSESGTGVGEVIFAFPSSNQAKKFMEASRAATRTCRSYKTTSGKTAVTRLSLPHLGDKVIGERETTTESPTGTSDSGSRAPGLGSRRRSPDGGTTS